MQEDKVKECICFEEKPCICSKCYGTYACTMHCKHCNPDTSHPSPKSEEGMDNKIEDPVWGKSEIYGLETLNPSPSRPATLEDILNNSAVKKHIKSLLLSQHQATVEKVKEYIKKDIEESSQGYGSDSAEFVEGLSSFLDSLLKEEK